MIFDAFTKKHDYLICVDSDGCVMDTMNCKHFRCFGPCMVDEWDLLPWCAQILARWNEINLFSMTRGINRFKGLALALSEIDVQYTPIRGIEYLRAWVERAPALSNDGLVQAISLAKSAEEAEILGKALAWSRAVNQEIVELPDEVKVPFQGAKEGLKAAHAFADVAMVSSANRDAVEEEWGRFDLLAHTDIVLAQDVGSKAACIARMLSFGYAPDHVLMIGDAPGDYDAAVKNGVYYYPILVGKEKESWERAIREAFPLLTEGAYAPYGEEQHKLFLENLGG